MVEDIPTHNIECIPSIPREPKTPVAERDFVLCLRGGIGGGYSLRNIRGQFDSPRDLGDGTCRLEVHGERPTGNSANANMNHIVNRVLGWADCRHAKAIPCGADDDDKSEQNQFEQDEFQQPWPISLVR